MKAIACSRCGKPIESFSYYKNTKLLFNRLHHFTFDTNAVN